MITMFDPRAHWIWIPRQQQSYNVYACFRRRFAITNSVSAASIRITADSRYDLYVNGQFVGHGPVRSWPSPWPVDQYEVGHLLRPGQNVIAVLAHHFGISTFQYLHDEPGLLAQLDYSDAAGEQTIVTDSSWRATPHNGYLWPVPRISCQQGWEE